tara:strand:+ start:898 stop:1284 length:387 start_codon:yes stop_codon:yes gene_type:complete
MFNKTKLSYYKLGAAVTTGLLVSQSAQAANNNFNSIASNINTSIASLPGLISALAYLFGVLLAVLGVMKIKDHVENPSQTPLKDGAIRLAAGGALFALPIILEAMTNTVGSGIGASTATLKGVSFGVN